MCSGDDPSAMSLFVARSRFRPPAYDAGALMDTDTAPAKMDDWVGIVWKILAERGGVCRANELFASLPRLQKAFTSRFPSPGPLVKAGTQSGVLFSLKVPGASLVQLTKAEHSVVDLNAVVTPVAVRRSHDACIGLLISHVFFVQRPAPVAAPKKQQKGGKSGGGGGGGGQTSNNSQSAVVGQRLIKAPSLATSVVADEEIKPELFAVSVEAPRADAWMCAVCECDNVLSAVECLVCLTPRD